MVKGNGEEICLMKKKYVNLTIVSFIVGFMLFVQYNTVRNPEIRETKDTWEIRNELSEEQKRHSNLISAIDELNKKLYQYEAGNDKKPEEILQETIDELQVQTGEKEVKGTGFTIEIKPSQEAIQFGYEVEAIQPMLLIRLINELNRNGASHLSIGGERLTMWTAIRDINGNTTVNGRALSKTSVGIVVLADTKEQANRLYNYVLASSLMDEFYIDNFVLDVTEVKELTISDTAKLYNHSYLLANE